MSADLAQFKSLVRRGPSGGFSLPELIAVIIIISVLVVVAAPKWVSSGINESALFQQTSAGLRYAQSAAIAMQRTVCAQFTATTVTFTYAPVYGSAVCSSNLNSPSGAAGPYQVIAQGSASFTVFPASVSFDRIGRPSAAQTITLSNGTQIKVEIESGYVH